MALQRLQHGVHPFDQQKRLARFAQPLAIQKIAQGRDGAVNSYGVCDPQHKIAGGFGGHDNLPGKRERVALGKGKAQRR